MPDLIKKLESSATIKQQPIRFVPTGSHSLKEDAPGWGSSPGSDKDELGPICWKCRGKISSLSDDHQKKQKQCRVCVGRGRLALGKKRKQRQTLEQDGRRARITAARPGPCDGPVSRGLQECDPKWANLVALADAGEQVLLVVKSSASRTGSSNLEDHDDDGGDASTARPIWMPRVSEDEETEGGCEELCRLVGSWRILQRAGSHRWTTDDLLTAWVASQELAGISAAAARSVGETSGSTLNYLDLGTGNASVLQMVVWSALKQDVPIQALGVEARAEAVQLAQRSLALNLGTNNIRDATTQASARVERGDFRDFAFSQQYDLITGTPPYFRVDFFVHEAGNDETIEAIIQEGGMPTARQSAPARCEFRGGIEAYCETAARLLNPKDDKARAGNRARLVLCENYQNHTRVLEAAQSAGLQIVRQVRVEGRPGRGTLFAVYVMVHSMDGCCGSSVTSDTKDVVNLTVRDNSGNWTKEYRQSVMKDMSIPMPA